LKKILAIALLVVGTTGMVAAAVRDVPEIDGGSAASAAALMGSAVLMLRRKKTR
jgi:beta-lactam-binding protein with PASTA domain